VSNTKSEPDKISKGKVFKYFRMTSDSNELKMEKSFVIQKSNRKARSSGDSSSVFQGNSITFDQFKNLQNSTDQHAKTKSFPTTSKNFFFSNASLYFFANLHSGSNNLSDLFHGRTITYNLPTKRPDTFSSPKNHSKYFSINQNSIITDLDKKSNSSGRGSSANPVRPQEDDFEGYPIAFMKKAYVIGFILMVCVMVAITINFINLHSDYQDLKVRHICRRHTRISAFRFKYR